MSDVAPHLRLLLLLAGTADRRAAARPAIERLLAAADPSLLAEAMERRRLLPLLGARLGALVPGAMETAPLGPVFRSARARDRAAALALEAQTRMLLRQLAEGGVRTLAVKGPGLAAAVHGDIGQRSSGDIDLLVDAEALPAAVDLLIGGGAFLLDDRLDASGLPVLHRRLAVPGSAPIDLHWRLHWHERVFSRELLRRARSGASGELEPMPADLGAALLLFYARDGFHGLRLACDLGGWWDRQGCGLGPGLLDDHARRHPELARTWAAAALAVESTVGVPAAAFLTTVPRGDRRVGLASRLANESSVGDRDQLAVNGMLLDVLLGPPGALRRLAARELLPAAGPPRVVHASKVLLRMPLAVSAARRGPRG